MHISNRDGWTLSLSHDSYSVKDPSGTIIDSPLLLVDGSLASKQEVIDKIKTLSKNASNAFSFQVFRNESKVAILVGPYGLAGGGKYGALAASIAGLVGGVALSFSNKKAGQALVASSFNAALYAYKTPSEIFDDKECLARAAIAGTTSLAASTLSDTLKGPIQDVISNPMAAQILSQSVVGLAQEGASQAIKGELDLKKMAVSVASTSASVFASETVNALIEAKQVSEIVIKAGVSGTASASAATVTEDLLTGKSLSNVPAAALSAGILSSINSLPGAFEISDAIKAVETANRNIPKPPEPPKPPAPPKKPDLSHLNIENRKKEIAAKEEAVSKQETAFSTAFTNARNRIANLLNAGFHDRAKWCKTAEDTANRIVSGEKITVRKKDHTISYKQSKVHNPVQERAALEGEKAALAKDITVADNTMAGYDASLKAYNQERDNKFIYCPPPPPPAPSIPKMGQLPVMANWNVERRELIVRQLVTRPSIEIAIQVQNSYQIELVERIEIAQQAIIGSHAPKTALASINENIKPERAVVLKKDIESIERINRLRESLESKTKDIEKAKNHLAYLQNKKDHAPKSARDKKLKLTEQIDAHNKRLESLINS